MRRKKNEIELNVCLYLCAANKLETEKKVRRLNNHNFSIYFIPMSVCLCVCGCCILSCFVFYLSLHSCYCTPAQPIALFQCKYIFFFRLCVIWNLNRKFILWYLLSFTLLLLIFVFLFVVLLFRNAMKQKRFYLKKGQTITD